MRTGNVCSTKHHPQPYLDLSSHHPPPPPRPPRPPPSPDGGPGELTSRKAVPGGRRSSAVLGGTFKNLSPHHLYGVSQSQCTFMHSASFSLYSTYTHPVSLDRVNGADVGNGVNGYAEVHRMRQAELGQEIALRNFLIC